MTDHQVNEIMALADAYFRSAVIDASAFDDFSEGQHYAAGQRLAARARLESALRESSPEPSKGVADEPVAYMLCMSHRFHHYTMEFQVASVTPPKQVCPICAGIATNVSGPHL